jgi:fumarate reductase subunit D
MAAATPDGFSLGEILEDSDAREVRPGPRLGQRRTESRLRQLLRPEPTFWGLFSIGGFVSALALPATVAVIGIAFAAGWLPDRALSYERVSSLAQNPIAKLLLLGLVSLPLFHWAHRFRYAVHHQLGVHGMRRLVAAACYGSAIAGTVLAVWILLRI